MLSLRACSICMEKDLDENDIFCPNCGSDLQTDSKIKKYTTTKNNIVAQVNSNPGADLYLTSETINDYQKLTHEVQDLMDTPHKLELASKQLQLMQSKLKEDENSLAELQKELKKNEHLTKKYENISVSFIIASLERNKDKKIETEEKEHSMLLFKIETLEKEIADQRDEIKTATEKTKNLQKLDHHFYGDQEALTKLITQITSGESDSTIDKLENDLNTILQNKKTLDEELHKNQLILNYLNAVIPDLNDTYVQLKLYCEYNPLDGFSQSFGIAFSPDNSSVYINMRLNFSNAKTSLARAGRNINLAGNVDQQISQINLIVKDINDVWNVIMKFPTQFEIYHARDSLPKIIKDITNICDTISTKIKSIKTEILSLVDKISNDQESMIAERSKMIQDAISSRNNT